PSALLRLRVLLLPRADLFWLWPELRCERPEDLFALSLLFSVLAERLPLRREVRLDVLLLRAPSELRCVWLPRRELERVAADGLRAPLSSEGSSEVPLPNQPNRRDRMPPPAADAVVSAAAAARGAGAGASRMGAGVAGR